MRFKADEIATIIKEEISRYTSVIDVAEVGKVLEVGDGVARIYGLPNAMAMEMLPAPPVTVMPVPAVSVARV